MIVLADESIAKLLEQERSFLNGCYVKLYTTAVLYDGSAVAADLIEPTDSGYLALVDPTPAFLAATFLAPHQGLLLGPPITWTFTLSSGAFTVAGYWLYDPATAKSVYLDFAASIGTPLVPAPVDITAEGQTYTVIPRKLLKTL